MNFYKNRINKATKLETTKLYMINNLQPNIVRQHLVGIWTPLTGEVESHTWSFRLPDQYLLLFDGLHNICINDFQHISNIFMLQFFQKTKVIKEKLQKIYINIKYMEGLI